MVEVNAYKLEHDFGFAPHPFHKVCTLACCKPDIRKRAEIGHYVIGMGSAALRNAGHLIYWMQVDAIISFDQYYRAEWAQNRKPNMSGNKISRVGDNIYHRLEGETEFIQDYSFHSLELGTVNPQTLKTDTAKTENVLVSKNFSYFGSEGARLPADLETFGILPRNFKCNFPEHEKVALVAWLNELPRFYRGRPIGWAKMPTS